MKQGRHAARLDGLAILVLAAAITLVSWNGFATGALLARLDTITQYLPWYRELGLSLREGRLPGWIPWTMSGAPFAGDPQSGWGYMPVMAIFALFPGKTGFEVLIVFHLALAALTAYAFGRVIGLGVAGSLVTGLIFPLNGLFERVQCCTIHVEVAVWLPVAMLGIEVGARAGSRRGRIAWWILSGIAASQMIAGWIGQGAAYGLLALAAYAAYRLLLSPLLAARTWRRTLAGFALWAGVAGTVTAVLAATVILPRLSVVDRSNLAGGSYAGIGDSAAQTGYWTLWQLVDRLLTEDDAAGRWYTGAAALALAALAPILARRRFQVPFFLPYALAVLVLTLEPTPLHRLLFLIPRFQGFHEHRPERVLTVFPFALAVLAGAAVASLTRVRIRHRWYAAAGLLPLVVAVAVDRVHPAGPRPISTEGVVAIAAVGAAVAVALATRGRRELLAALSVLILVVIWDPGVRDIVRGTYAADEADRDRAVATYEGQAGAAEFLVQLARDGELFRFYGYDPARLTFDNQIRTYHVSYLNRATLALLVNNRAIRLGVQDIQGYNPIQIQRYVDFFTALNGGMEQSYHAANVLASGATSPLLDLLNAAYVVVPATIPPGRPDLLHLAQRNPTVYADDRVRVLRRVDALPRAWIVHRAVGINTDERTLELLATRSVDPRQQALVPTDAGAPKLAPAADAGAEAVTVTAYAPERIALDATLSAEGMVVLSEVWDPDWRVTVDGRTAQLYRVDGILRGVVVPAGQHEIVFTYRPTVLVATAIVSGIGWVAVLLGAAGLAGQWALGRRVRPGHHPERHEAPAGGAVDGRPEPEPGPLVDADRAGIEGRHRQPEPGRPVPSPALGQDRPHERQPEAAPGEVGP